MEEKTSRGENTGTGTVRQRIKRVPTCRFGSECFNIETCKFLHPAFADSINGLSATVPALSPNRNKTKAATKPEQKNQSSVLESTSSGPSARTNTTKKPTLNKASPNKPSRDRDRSKIQCRYGMACKNKKCPFFHHPAAANKETSDAATTGSSPASTGLKQQPDNHRESLTGLKPIEKKITITSPSRKLPSKKKCRWGAGCRNKKCAFLHPQHQIDSDSPVLQKKKTGGESISEGSCVSSAAVVIKNYVILGSHASLNVAATNPGVSNAPLNGTTNNRIPTYAENSTPHRILPPSPETQPSSQINPSGYHSSMKLFSSPKSENKAHSHLSSSSSLNANRHISENLPPTPPSDWLSRNVQSYVSSMEATNATSMQQDEPVTSFSKQLNQESFHHTPYSGTLNEQSDLSPQPIGFGMANTGSDDSQDMNPDAEWLFEVLGLNDLLSEDSGENMQWQQNNNVMDGQNFHGHDMIEGLSGQYEQLQSKTVNEVREIRLGEIPNMPTAPYHTTRYTEAPHNLDPSINAPSKFQITQKTKVQLLPEDEIGKIRRAALELRLESQGNGRNPELLPTLLHTCRSKQDVVKGALEQSMDVPHVVDGSVTEIDEANVLALLELNELLLSSIKIAESSLRDISTTSMEQRKGSTPEAKSVNESLKKIDASWTSAGKKQNQQTEVNPQTKPYTKLEKSLENAVINATQTQKPKKSAPSTTQKAVATNTSAQFKEEKTAPVSFESPTLVESPAKNYSGRTDDVSEPNSADAIDTVQQEKERMARMLEEARQQVAVARERKKNKKSKKLDKWIKEQEQLKSTRSRFWSERIAKENDYIDLIQKLILAEFLRQSKSKAMGLSAERVLSDSHALEVLAEESREAFHVMFGELKCRVEVAGSDKKDFNGRLGTLRYWDKDRERFCVGLDTKKSPDSDVQFLSPENLDIARPLKTEKKSTSNSYDVTAPDLLSYGGVTLGLNFTLDKSHVIALGSSESTKKGLEQFCNRRDEDERQSKIAEEAEKRREEEDRKRRAARKSKENAAWERRKEQMHQEKEEYERMKREWAQETRKNGGSYDHFSSNSYSECHCPQCRFGDKFFSSGGAFFFNIGGMPFRVRFDDSDDDNDDDDSFFDEFDETWERRLEEEKEEENRKQAKILGVAPDADERSIKMAYRKMALQYHPDKWRHDSDHGMTKDEAENRFKVMQSAYDHLMLNFDD